MRFDLAFHAIYPNCCDIVSVRLQVAPHAVFTEDVPSFVLQMKHRLEKAVSQAGLRLEKKIQSLEKQGGQTDKHLHTKKLADLLMSNLHR